MKLIKGGKVSLCEIEIENEKLLSNIQLINCWVYIIDNVNEKLFSLLKI